MFISVPVRAVAEEIFDAFTAQKGFLGAFLIGIGVGSEFECLLTSNIPIEPYNGNEHHKLGAVLSDCTKVGKPHIHNIGNTELASVIGRHCGWNQSSKRVYYHQWIVGNRNMCILGFVKPGADAPAVSSPDPLISRVVSLLIIEREHSEAVSTLRATERFVREVGHDFAVNVQAVVARINTLKKGRLSAEAAQRKLVEIENDIKAAYSQAEQLGITIDSTYEKRNERFVTLIDIVHEAKDQLESEARERKIEFNVIHYNDTQVWGDPVALKVAVIQVLHNAVKYAFGSSRIDVDFIVAAEFLKLNVVNVGHPLPLDKDQSRIWELGFRGQYAKECHVNGSGVGLFTVSKIVKAHHGGCTAIHRNTKTIVTLALPKKDIQRAKTFGGLPFQ